MIGANTNPMSMFTGGGNEAFDRGQAIGAAASPFTAMGNALKGTVDTYHSALAAQATQEGRQQDIQTKYSTLGKNRLDYEAAKTTAAKDIADSTPPWAKNFDPTNPIMVPDGKGGKIPAAPVWSSDGRVIGIKPITQPFNFLESVMGQGGGGQTPSATAQALQKLQESTDALHAQMNSTVGGDGTP